MYCSHCGTQNPQEAQFCLECGKVTTWSTRETGPRDPLEESATEFQIPKGSTISNRYRIERMLGMGGMGRVYLAKDGSLQMPVALKVLHNAMASDPLSVSRLKDEARLSIQLTHQNIVRIHNFEEWNELRFIVMEYVDGESLSLRLAREGALSEGEVKRLAIEICRGLEAAHEEKVVHRDLKPGNILLTREGRAKVADFGIARAMQDSVSRLTGRSTAGTPIYMAPEQVMGTTSPLSDLYSLGVILYELLTGSPPFHTGDISLQILERQPEALPGNLEIAPVVMKLLAKRPEDRFDSALELSLALKGEIPVIVTPRPAANSSEQSGSEKGIGVIEPGTLWRNRLGMEFLWVPPGKGLIGSPTYETDRRPDERRHEVLFQRGFYLARTVVTQDQWQRVMKGRPWLQENGRAMPGVVDDPQCPVTYVSYGDVMSFLNTLTRIDPGARYRLPTEEEWEYACRAGSPSSYSFGEDRSEFDRFGWRKEGVPSDSAQKVGLKKPNPWGIYDMHGNVWEWCLDWYLEYGKSNLAPGALAVGSYRVVRGGAWTCGIEFCRCAFRGSAWPADRRADLGFRVIRESLQ